MTDLFYPPPSSPSAREGEIFRFAPNRRIALKTIEVMAVVLCVVLARNERNRTWASIERNFVPKQRVKITPEQIAPTQRVKRAPYFAYSVALVSLITLTFISPGYCKVVSISFAIFRAITTASLSLTLSLCTITRISRPALIA